MCRRKRKRSRPLTLSAVAKFIGAELKFGDNFKTDSALTNTAAAAGGEHDPSASVSLNSLTRGSAPSNRDGGKVTMRRIDIHGLVHTASFVGQVAPHGQVIVAIWLVLKKMTNGVTIVSEEVFKNPGGATLAPFPFRNVDQIAHFRVLAKVMFTTPVPPIAGADAANDLDISGTSTPWEMHVDLKDIEATYSGGTAVISDQITNSLHLIAWVDNVEGTPLLDYNSRLRFIG